MFYRKKINHAILIGAFLLFAMNAARAQNLLNGPESVAYDSLNDCYFVSNVRDGKIIKIKRDGFQEEFVSGYGACLGNCISGRVLYFTSGFRIYGIDLDTRAEIKNMGIAAATNLDGITSDKDGNLYAVETINKKIFKVNSATDQVTLFAVLPAEEFPQDVVYDKFKNRLLVVSYRAQSPILQISLTDSTVSEALPTNAGRYDGITIDDEGNVYAASHWGTGSVFKFDNDFALPPVLAAAWLSDPAGLDYDPVNNILAVPEFSGNRVRFVDLNTTGVTEEKENIGFSISQNYPNPFNPTTKIKFCVPDARKTQTAGAGGASSSPITKLIVYDILGNEVAVLLNEEKDPGIHEIEFDASRLPSGVYIYTLNVSQHSASKKMILLK